MSDHDAAPDPMDKAYAQAEAVLSDDNERAARRARVLGAVASAPATPAVSAPTKRPSAWGRGGWLVAASVAGVSVFLAVRVNPPASLRPPPAPAVATAPAAPAEASPEVVAPPQPSARAASPTAKSAPPTVSGAAPAATPSSSHGFAGVAPAPQAEPTPPPQVVTAERRAAPPPPAPSSSLDVQELVVTGSRREEARDAPARIVAPLGTRARRVANLREAAAAGRTSEVDALLATGIQVDATDDEGETALMRSIQARQPEVAALLRRRGADLDRKNRAGVSARDMATAIDNPELNRALGLSR